MKKVNSWTQEEQSEFIHLFANVRMLNIAKVGETVFTFPRKEEAFFEVKTFMEEKWPKLWRQYFMFCLTGWGDQLKCTIGVTGEVLETTFNKQLNLTNLVAFLLKPEQVEKWGWVECQSEGVDEGTKYRMCDVDLKSQKSCDFCSRKIKHPALLYAEGLK